MPKSNTSARSITYASAINEATRQLMAEDDSVFVLGIGVDDPRGPWLRQPHRWSLLHGQTQASQQRTHEAISGSPIRPEDGLW